MFTLLFSKNRAILRNSYNFLRRLASNQNSASSVANQTLNFREET